MLDRDLAEMYGVTTKALNQAVARNSARFPIDFAFRLTTEEAAHLRSQSVTSSSWGGRRYAARAFTEQGVAMLSSVLRSKRAVDVNIAIMSAFVHVRELLATHTDLARKLAEMERKYDGKFAVGFNAIRELPGYRTRPARPARGGELSLWRGIPVTPFPRLDRQRGPEVVGERDDNVEGQTQSASRLPSCP